MSALDRWSERRRRVAEAEAVEATEAAGQGELAPSPAAPDPEREAELAGNRAAAEAVDLDALRPGSDLGPFFREGVPEALRARALKALWRSDPVFANIDRLCDYDDDFRAASMVPGAIQSAWQAGRGYLFPDDAEGDDASGERADENENEDEGRTEGGSAHDGADASTNEPPVGDARPAVPPPEPVAATTPGSVLPANASSAATPEAPGTDEPKRRATAPSLRARLGV